MDLKIQMREHVRNICLFTGAGWYPQICVLRFWLKAVCSTHIAFHAIIKYIVLYCVLKRFLTADLFHHWLLHLLLPQRASLACAVQI